MSFHRPPTELFKGIPFLNKCLIHPIEQAIASNIIQEDFSAFDSPKGEMMETSGHVDTGFFWA